MPAKIMFDEDGATKGRKEALLVVLVVAFLFVLIFKGPRPVNQTAPESAPVLTSAPAKIIKIVPSQEGQREKVDAKKGLTAAAVMQNPADSAERIKEAQRLLSKGGYYKGSADGKVGPMTKKAIEKFQFTRRLKVDGVIGPKTWEELTKLNSFSGQDGQEGKIKRSDVRE